MPLRSQAAAYSASTLRLRATVQHRPLGARRVPPRQPVVVLGDEARCSRLPRRRRVGPTSSASNAVVGRAAAGSRRSARRGPSGHGGGRAPRPSAGGWSTTSANVLAEMAAIPVGVLTDRAPMRARVARLGVDEDARSAARPTRSACSSDRHCRAGGAGRTNRVRCDGRLAACDDTGSGLGIPCRPVKHVPGLDGLRAVAVIVVVLLPRRVSPGRRADSSACRCSSRCPGS